MTDSARDVSSDGAAAQGGAVPQSARTMTDIARLFMAGAARGASRPVRQPPTASAQAGAAASIDPHAAKVADPTATAPSGAAAAAALHPSLESPSARPQYVETMSKERTDSAGTPEVNQESRAESNAHAAAAVEIALQDSSGAPGYAALLEAARRIASDEETTVGLVAYDGEYLRVISIAGGRGSAPAAPALTFATAPAGADVQIARTLYGLRTSVRRWLIALPRMDEHLARSMLASSAHWLLISGVDSDSLIGSYRTLKGVCGLIAENTRRPAAVRLLVQSSDDAEQTRVHTRLNQVARGFLEQELERIDMAPARPVPLHAALALRVVELDASTLVAAWYAVLDFVQEITGSTLLEDEQYSPDPDEPGHPGAADPDMDPRQVRAQQTCSIDIDAEPVDDLLDDEQREAIAECMADVLASGPSAQLAPAAPAADSEAAPEEPVETEPVAAPAEHSELLEESIELKCPAVAVAQEAVALTEIQASPLRAISLAGVTSRTALWQALKAAVCELVPGLRVLPATPPLGDCQLMIDAGGRLHVAVLADESALGWAGIWQWARQARGLLALTRGGESLDSAADVCMHVILPAGGHSSDSGLPPNVLAYRIQPIIFGDQSGAVIVPLS